MCTHAGPAVSAADTPPAVEMNKNTANFVHNALAERPVFHV